MFSLFFNALKVIRFAMRIMGAVARLIFAVRAPV